MDRAEHYFRDALGRRADYGEAASNLALVLVSEGQQADAAVTLLQGVLERTPEYEAAYVTLAKIHLSAGRTSEGVAVLEAVVAKESQTRSRARTNPAVEALIRARPRISNAVIFGTNSQTVQIFGFTLLSSCNKLPTPLQAHLFPGNIIEKWIPPFVLQTVRRCVGDGRCSCVAVVRYRGGCVYKEHESSETNGFRLGSVDGLRSGVECVCAGRSDRNDSRRGEGRAGSRRSRRDRHRDVVRPCRGRARW